MRRFIITESEADLTSHAGLGLIGMAINERTNLGTDAEALSPLCSDAMPHATILSSYIAMLCLGKSDFEAINGFREDSYLELDHSEFMTDLDIEPLPTGKFATNALLLACAVLTYNMLRWIGQNGLLGPDAPPRYGAKRRRVRTVMQELMYLAARQIHAGR